MKNGLSWIIAIVSLTALLLLPGAQPNLEYSGTVCGGNNLRMNCPTNYIIRVQSAFYGRDDATVCLGGVGDVRVTTCSDVDILATFRRTCDGEIRCVVDVDTLRDPCPGVSKYLRSKYHCIMPVKEVTTCSSSVMMAECPANQVIKVEDAFLGRKDAATCAPSDGGSSDGRCAVENFRSRVETQCKWRGACSVRVSNGWLRDDNGTAVDDCDGVEKYATMEYHCFDCVNAHGNDTECEKWADDGQCDGNKDWMTAFCRKSCWLCKNHTFCENYHLDDRQCDEWAQDGVCWSNSDYMTLHCANSCNYCMKNIPWYVHLRPYPTPTPNTLPPVPSPPTATLRTSVACESEITQLTCPPNEYIHVWNAFFGRKTGNETCPHVAIATVQCYSENNVHGRAEFVCNGRNTCQLKANTAAFSEPCDGTYKYLEVNYTCNECVNKHQDTALCDKWASEGECSSNFGWMRRNCFRSCSGCDNAETCQNVNEDVNCDYWASFGECVANKNWMDRNCQRSCRTCDANYVLPTRRPMVDAATVATTADTAPPTTSRPTSSTAITAAGITTTKPPITTARATTSTRSSAVESSTSASGCTDSHSMCSIWRGQGECLGNRDWMSKNCAKTCQVCSLITTTSATTTTSAPPSAICTDAHGNSSECLVWRNENECTLNANWMTRNCARSCGKCRDADCDDLESECPVWASSGECAANRNWMSRNCALSCGCPTVVTTTTAAATATSPPATSSPAPSTSAKITESSTVATTSSERPCRNRESDSDCAYWAKVGECENNPQFMDTFCRVACSDCVPLTTTTPTKTPTSGAVTTERGLTTQIHLSCAAVKHCSGHGRCVNHDVCECEKGWIGNSCSVATCTGVNECSNHGICIRPDTCICHPFYTGRDCSLCSSSNPVCLPCPRCLYGSCNQNEGTEQEVSYMGCYQMDYNMQRQDSPRTLENCLAVCRTHSFKFAGVTNQLDCYCAKDYGSRGISKNCDHTCLKGNQQHCNVSTDIAVYMTYYGKCDCPKTRRGDFCERCVPAFTGSNCDTPVFSTKSSTVEQTTPTPRRPPVTNGQPFSRAPTSQLRDITTNDKQTDVGTVPPTSPAPLVLAKSTSMSVKVARKWNDAYNDLQSPERRKFVSSLKEDLLRLYQSVNGQASGVEVLELRRVDSQEALIVDHRVHFQSIVDPRPRANFTCAIDRKLTEQNGRIDDYSRNTVLVNEDVGQECSGNKCPGEGELARSQEGKFYCECPDNRNCLAASSQTKKSRLITIIVIIIAATLPMIFIFVLCCLVGGKKRQRKGLYQANVHDGTTKSFQYHSNGKPAKIYSDRRLGDLELDGDGYTPRRI